MEYLKKIAVVEDNPFDAELITRNIELYVQQVSITHFPNGISILQFANEHLIKHPRRPSPFHAILLDLKMPQVDGFEVLQTLRTNHQFRYTPIIVLTSSGERDDITRSYQLGANSYVIKPLEPKRYKETIKAVSNYWLTINQLATNAL